MIVNIPDGSWTINGFLTEKNNREEITISSHYEIIDKGDLCRIDDRIGMCYQAGFYEELYDLCYTANVYLCPIEVEDPEMWFKADAKQRIWRSR
jgi:hypothetical protein